MKWYSLSFILGFVLTGFVNSSQAAIVNINSLTSHEGNPVILTLSPGEYTVTPIGRIDGGAFDAWNPWGGSVSGCDVNGANCITGWINWYFVNSTEFPEQELWDSNRYASPSLALENAIGTFFILTSESQVSFYIKDGVNGSMSYDNSGGISLDVSAVPIPAAILLFGTGLIGLIGIARRKKA